MVDRTTRSLAARPLHTKPIAVAGGLLTVTTLRGVRAATIAPASALGVSISIARSSKWLSARTWVSSASLGCVATSYNYPPHLASHATVGASCSSVARRRARTLRRESCSQWRSTTAERGHYVQLRAGTVCALQLTAPVTAAGSAAQRLWASLWVWFGAELRPTSRV
jgi:hypothetical protein